MPELVPVATLSFTALDCPGTVRPGDDLAAMALRGASAAGITFVDGDVLVVAQKIVSKAEDRFVDLRTVVPSQRARELAAECHKDPRLVELVLRQSREVLRCQPGVLVSVHRLGLVLANAGIDASNVERQDGDTVLLLPENPDASAQRLRDTLRQRSGVEVGVVINDSLGRAWRLGSVGVAIGVAGIPALVDLRDRPDRNGRLMQSSMLGAADELAAGASLLMGQANESRPMIHLRGFPYGRREAAASELLRPPEEDMFR